MGVAMLEEVVKKSEDIILMFGDTQVMRINFDYGVYDILSDKHMPYGLRGQIVKVPEESSNMTKYEKAQIRVAERNNQDAVITWLTGRTLLLSRSNAKWIFNALGIPQIETQDNKLKIALVCRAVSVLDKYWVKNENDGAEWKYVDIRSNPLNEIVTQIALHGKSLTFQGSYNTPELTTNGAYAKAWRRVGGKLWLYKLSANGNTESRIEVMVSNILDKCNVEHVHYDAGSDDGKYVCMCPCMADEKYSIVPAMEYYSYCNVNGLDFEKEILRIDKDGYYKMHIVDYLISNRDRHMQNWGFFMDNVTMEIVSLHWLFDHNNAFDTEWMQDKDVKYQCTEKSLRESAIYAMNRVDFHFTALIERDDFITERQYKSFMERAIELRIVTKKEPKPDVFAAVNKMAGD